MVCLSTRVQHGQTAPKFFGDSQFITFFLEQIPLCKEGNNRFHFRMDTRRNSHRDMDMVPNIQNQGEYSQKYKLCLLHIQSHKLAHSHKLSREPRDPRDSRVSRKSSVRPYGPNIWESFLCMNLGKNFHIVLQPLHYWQDNPHFSQQKLQKAKDSKVSYSV